MFCLSLQQSGLFSTEKDLQECTLHGHIHLHRFKFVTEVDLN